MRSGPVPTLEWKKDRLVLVDQTRLPTELVRVECATADEVWNAIRRLVVRGAPAIGVAAAYGVVLGAKQVGCSDTESFRREVGRVADHLATARPTAANLFWALDRMRAVAAKPAQSVSQIMKRLRTEADRILDEDRQICRAIGRHGAALLADGHTILTHCNAGSLATADYGTALAAVFSAADQGKRIAVYADETRPLLQGSRLTAWELQQAGIDVTVICDNMAAAVMREGKIDAVMTGADRIAANGDTANKIGTYGLAVLAKVHRIPFYVAAPKSTFDMTLRSGDEIPIEQRSPDEVTKGFGRQTAPDGVKVYNPAFDVTPHRYITAFITEAGVVRPPYSKSLKKLFATDSRSAGRKEERRCW